jgi:Cu+-exporting ATPase
MTPRADSKTIDLQVHGMTCGACVARVEGALRAAPGVRDASVNLLQESARVVADPAADRAAMIHAVRAAGYDAEPLPAARELAAAPVSDPQRRELLRRQRQAMILAIGLTLPILALDHLGHGLEATHAAGSFGRRLIQGGLLALMLAGPAGGPILAGGVRAVLHRTANMDLLISLGVSVAFASSIYGTLAFRPEFIHYHAAAVILMLVAIGRYLEIRARGQTSAAMAALARRAPKTALVRRGDALIEIAATEIAVGDLVSVPPHHAVPADGVIVEGQAAIDESLMTGEPLPVTRRAGDEVLGGTLVVDGTIVVRATRTGSAATIGRIMRLVSDAQASHTPMQRLADRVAAVFTPIVVTVALLTFAGWIVAKGTGAVAPATSAAIATLVIACPCAMGLATPTAIAVASGVAALRGILARDAAALETLGRIDTVVWDKTGTLTEGRPVVVAVTSAPSGDARELLRLAASAEQFSPHPLAKAIVAHARRNDVSLAEPDEFESVPGGGVAARVAGKSIVVGSRSFLAARAVVATNLAGTPGATSVCVAFDGTFAGTIELRDNIRPSSAQAVERLRRLGIDSHLLTGDAEPAARAVAEEIGIAGVRAAASPADKIACVRDLRTRGRRVAMIGDGVNDAAALAAADVGVAFATGADVAAEAAGINLIGSTPLLVADAVDLSRATTRIIRENLFWAFGYNVVMIPLAAVGILPPWFAAGAMMASSLTVVLNALRLRRSRATTPN